MLIKYSKNKRRKKSKRSIVNSQYPTLKQSLPSEHIVKHKPELHQIENNILVKRIQNKLTHSLIRPSTMYQKQRLEKSKLSKSKISRTSCLHPFIPTNSDTDMGRLYHAHVISTVAYCESYCSCLFYHFDYKCFLKGRHTTANH